MVNGAVCPGSRGRACTLTGVFGLSRFCWGMLLVFNALVMIFVFKWITFDLTHSPLLSAPQRNVWEHPASMSNFSEFWNHVDSLVGNDTLYPETFDVDVVLEALRNVKITHADIFVRDYSYKWMLTLEGGRRAIFKPLIMILGLRNMAYTTGRIFSWWEDILPVASEGLANQFSLEGRSSICTTPVKQKRLCFEDGTIHGALIYWLEPRIELFVHNRSTFYEYKPSSERENVTRELDRLPGDDTYCKEFRSREVYREDTWFADITDIAVMDFLTSHLDSTHSYIRDGKIEKMNVMIDFGRAFCEYEKRLRLVAPVIQCCKIRKRVYESLLRHRIDLLDVFVAMTKDDPLHPILGQDLQDLIGTRLQQLLSLVDYCVQKTSLYRVLMDL